MYPSQRSTKPASGKPVNIPFTSRQKLTTRNGVELERQSIYAPAETWAALQRLCTKQQRSGSEIIQSLISLADLGTLSQDKPNDKTSPSN